MALSHSNGYFSLQCVDSALGEVAPSEKALRYANWIDDVSDGAFLQAFPLRVHLDHAWRDVWLQYMRAQPQSRSVGVCDQHLQVSYNISVSSGILQILRVSLTCWHVLAVSQNALCA